MAGRDMVARTGRRPVPALSRPPGHRWPRDQFRRRNCSRFVSGAQLLTGGHKQATHPPSVPGTAGFLGCGAFRADAWSGHTGPSRHPVLGAGQCFCRLLWSKSNRSPGHPGAGARTRALPVRHHRVSLRCFRAQDAPSHLLPLPATFGLRPAHQGWCPGPGPLGNWPSQEADCLI